LTPSSSATSPVPGASAAVVTPANRSYFPALDGLRALAFLMVFGQHYLNMPWGWSGVDVFFVLSGFLITGILFDTQDDPHRVRNFYVRRTLRIFPLYYGLMILLVVSYPVFRWDWTWDWLLWPAYLGNFARGVRPFTHGSPLQMLADFQPFSRTLHGVLFNFGHFWSLCVEEQFYLIWPWVVFWVRDRRKLMWICVAFVVVCPLARIAAYHMMPWYMIDQEVLYRWTPFRIDALLLGGLVALIRRGPAKRGMSVAARRLSPVLLALVFYWMVVIIRHPEGNTHPVWSHTWGLTFVDLLSACLIVMALDSGSITFRIFNVGPLRWLGRISYGAYVFHDILHPEFTALVTYWGTVHARTLAAALALASTLVMSWVSFRWYETPFIRLKERWTRATPRVEG